MNQARLARRALRDLVYRVPVLSDAARGIRSLGSPSRRSGKVRFAGYLPPDPVVIEAGAYNGADTLDLAAQWPLGHVHAFEPVPVLYRDLVRATARRKNVSCYPLALAASDGEATFHLSSGASDASGSLLHPTGHLTDHPDVRFEEEITVSTVNLDSWIGTDPSRRPDFLWLDLQGAEMAVLEASPLAVASARIVYCEVSLHESYAGGAVYPVLRAFMEAAGFRVAREEIYWSDGGNVLFARPEAGPDLPAR